MATTLLPDWYTSMTTLASAVPAKDTTSSAAATAAFLVFITRLRVKVSGLLTSSNGTVALNANTIHKAS